jgi:hypothetical protein
MIVGYHLQYQLCHTFRLQAQSVLIDTGLQPGVKRALTSVNRFNGLPHWKPLKRFRKSSTLVTGLKPGVNESAPRELFTQNYLSSAFRTARRVISAVKP